MREVRLGAECRLIEIVERGQPVREELAEDDTLGKALGRPEAESSDAHVIEARREVRNGESSGCIGFRATLLGEGIDVRALDRVAGVVADDAGDGRTLLGNGCVS